MKKIMINLVWALILTLALGVSAQETQKTEPKKNGKTTTLTIKRQVHVANVVETKEVVNDSTTRVITTTTYTPQVLETTVEASRQHALGLGNSPQVSELSDALVAQGNSAVTNAWGGAIEKNPNNVRSLEKAPAPGAKNDQRAIGIIDLGGGFYQRGSGSSRAIYFGDKVVDRARYEIALKSEESMKRLLEALDN